VATSSAAPPFSSGKPPTAPGALKPEACAIKQQVNLKNCNNGCLKNKEINFQPGQDHSNLKIMIPDPN
jgi:hypothetical protein